MCETILSMVLFVPSLLLLLLLLLWLLHLPKQAFLWASVILELLNVPSLLFLQVDELLEDDLSLPDHVLSER